jgi:NNMT/PNMT/TEMT family protein
VNAYDVNDRNWAHNDGRLCPYDGKMDLRSPGVVNPKSREVERKLNAEAPWNAFDPVAYIDHNYRFLRPDDAEILRVIRDHFIDHFRGKTRKSDEPVRAIDVGAGANLYPALAMLPWCDEITLFERSIANVDYLRGQCAHYDSNWDAFWDVLHSEDPYRGVPDPRAEFGRVIRVEQGDLFDLDHHTGAWSLGTMFFVAESMSTSRAEFETGVERFMRALAPGSPFAAAFMEGSLGYEVGAHAFPACSVSKSDVQESLIPYARGEVAITPVGMPGGALRPGYEGMIVACGLRGSE